MRWRLFTAGSCRHVEAVAVKGGAWRQAVFPAMFAAVETTGGWLVVDTGYAPRVMDLCRTGWWRLYRLMLPFSIRLEDSAVRQLEDSLPRGAVIAGIFLTHFHVDHEGGLRDFPAVPIYAGREARKASGGLSGWSALKAVHLPELLPDDFAERLRLIDCGKQVPPGWVPDGWSNGADVLGDGSLWAVPLPGHAAGQLGLMFRDEGGMIIFLVADALWRVDWLLHRNGPRWPVWFFTHDWPAFHHTLGRLRRLATARPEIRIIPFHCAQTAEHWIGGK